MNFTNGQCFTGAPPAENQKKIRISLMLARVNQDP